MRPAEGYTAAQLCSFLFCHSPGGTGCQRDRLEPRVSEACIHPIDEDHEETPQRERQANSINNPRHRSQSINLLLNLRYVLRHAQLRGEGLGFGLLKDVPALLG